MLLPNSASTHCCCVSTTRLLPSPHGALSSNAQGKQLPTMQAHKAAGTVVAVDICKHGSLKYNKEKKSVKCVLSLLTDFLFQILLEWHMAL